jgi:hypothetical protein
MKEPITPRQVGHMPWYPSVVPVGFDKNSDGDIVVLIVETVNSP